MTPTQHRKVLLACTLALSCGGAGAKYPWGSTDARVAAEHADVRTLNDGYRRTQSQVLVREVERPTRAALDWAAYHANFMIADPEPERPPPAAGAVDTTHPFAGVLDKATLTSDVQKTTLTAAERKSPLAFAPLTEFLLSHKAEGAERIQQVGAAVRSETWGFPATAGSPYQTVSELFLHTPTSGPTELWAKVEVQPWFRPLAGSPDQDGDGVPEIFGRVRADLVTPAVVASVQRDYMATVLSASEVKRWANQLSSYWYPSFNTDLVPAGTQWPDDRTEAPIKSELGGKTFPNPTFVLRGKPQGKPTYEVFIVKTAAGPEAAAGLGVVKLPKSRPAPQTKPIIDATTAELAQHGSSSWAAWAGEVLPLHETISRKLKAIPPKTKGVVGADGYLFYRHSLEYVVGGDLEKQKKGKNPLPIIVEFKKKLEEHGVDFLFVPVPTKVEIYPDELDAKGKPFVGKVINPFSRKFLQSLSRAGVEVVDLLQPFLTARAASGAEEPLYQHQDTHWTDRGLRIAADILTARVKQYTWYPALSEHAQRFGTRETTFTRFGDLHSRIAEADQSKFKPETLIAHQVLAPSGAPYDDDADSPVVVLGDSFTGVYELTDAEHAGVSAHLARGISYPVDLVMSYGGGPNVRQKLMRRGEAALNDKKLVIWMMTARDLFDYWENWEPL
jgi:hypothetical protein